MTGKWKTKITNVKQNELVTRGYRQENLIEKTPFSDSIYLILKGELPASEAESRVFSGILTACLDHGVTSPSAQASRIVASGGVPTSTAVAGGILSIGDYHGGAIEQGMEILQEGVKRINEGRPFKEVAESIIEDHKRVPGYGHRIHTKDPRTKKLFELADEYKVSAEHVKLAEFIEKRLEDSIGKKIPINVDGAIAAIASDMGFDWRLGKGLFNIGRMPGLVAHVYEEITREKPMRKMGPSIGEFKYDGPEKRELPDRYG